MSSVLLGRMETVANANGRSLRSWTLPHAWTARQRRSVFVATAALVAILAGIACTTWDLAGLREAEKQLTDAERMRSEAERSVARLPALRAAGASRQMQRIPADSVAEDIHSVSEAASRSGLSLRSLEPSASGGTGAETFRTLKLAARGSFAQLRGFLAGLAEAPGLIVPLDITIKRGGGLSLSATLQVFDRLPALPLVSALPVAGADGSPFDPFAEQFTAGAGADTLRLAGIMQDGMAIVALVETPTGTESVRAGQSFGSGRVERVASSHVVLSSSAGNQTLNFAEEAQ
jgi:type II secretory pathway component PulM